MKVANTSYIRIFSINVYEKIYIVIKIIIYIHLYMHVHISYGYTAIAFNVDVSDIATIEI